MTRIVLLVLLCLSCTPSVVEDDKNCCHYKISLPLERNSAAYCYNIEAPDLICNFENGVSLCQSRGKFLYKIVWYSYAGDVYEFIDNKEVLYSYISLEGNEFVYRRVDNNEVIRYCTLSDKRIRICN